MFSQKLRGERLALQRCSGASVVLAVFLIPLAYFRFSAVPSAGTCPELPEPQPLPQVDACPASSAPDAAARERFAAVFVSYMRRHKATVALLDAPDPWADPKAAASLRLVVAQVSREGLGNRLPGLVTAFALALLTDRILFVDDAVGGFYGIFSPAFDCNYTQSRQAAAQSAPEYKEERLRGLEATFLLGDLRARYKDPAVLRYEFADYQLPLLAANARYRRFLGEMAPNFGVIGAPLLRPEPALAAEAAELYAANVPPGSLVVGTHIRLHKRGSYMPPVRWYADTALAIGLRNAVPERLRFFIAGDDTPAIAEFTAAVTEAVRRDWNVTGAVVFQRPGRRHPSSALVDMLVLGLCNETVITYGSSFGYVATAMALRPPHYQQHLYQDNVYLDPAVVAGRPAALQERVADDHVFFWKALVAEPCYWDSKALLTGAFSGGDADLHARLVAAFRSNVYWQQYSQCHWATARACGNVTCAEREGRA